MTRINAFLFDLDGVLVDSYRCWWSLINEVQEKRGKVSLTQSEFDATWGQGPEMDQQMFFPEKSVAQVLQYYEQNFYRHVHLVKPEPGVGAVLQELRASNKRVGVASNSPTAVVRLLLRETGVESYLEAIVGADQVNAAKPAPDLLYRLLEKLEVNREQACYVGDSVFDEKAAQAAGVLFIGYKRKGNRTIQQMTELLDFKEELW